MEHKELLVIKRASDFAKWLFQHSGRFPKSHRFSVAVRLENTILTFIELTTAANMRRNKIPLLQEADESLAKLKVIFRLSHDMGFINFKSYQYGGQKLVELGKLLGGWMKNPGKSKNS